MVRMGIDEVSCNVINDSKDVKSKKYLAPINRARFIHLYWE